MSILAFQKPDKLVKESADEFKGLFEFKPLEKGYGVTVGNALRRILLSSLEGYAIVGIKFPNVLHEYSTIDGVVEDVTEIILNLKKVRFKAEVENPSQKININISGKSEFKAGDIAQFTEEYKVLNPDFTICNLDESVNLQVEFTMMNGRGYLSADEQAESEADDIVGFIPIDAIFTPVKNVRYHVEDFRVDDRTDFEKLVIEVITDGSVEPEESLKDAANILIQHFMLFSDNNMIIDDGGNDAQVEIDDEYLRMRKLLKTSLSDLDLSVRAYNCLKAADVKTLGDLASLEISDMMKFRNFGKKSLTELEQLMTDKKLSFGMDVTKYRLDED
ncbi:DNA-directed RNA polymerase subunit alpha [Flammeovirga yaeyamensis]|uniref:DNA-directed RNA polymerase subunit alpha n=1 Tax=Flammeovirga yaeyamensis TaxID=367791 RepID=A0AAX1N2V7_9BACT|nr:MULTISPECIES: DNA-directed RNA polymerase subunit alpha [Flammeovirga]ANQ51013.1 DNA-directed RNA polymerase subunit alpha [Flammeovirga sp. MY04]MBB3701110.1 DNA-directed RNA polymerase subunit alpha [Flammeovirga yaeyamensis]NMF38423.1 DNA-directed RNA polymerase subunit alpha [Flammeovirga yaeyamensis]QWG01577.1 DNA-directed RNA polymerase subunit alpha [Flammeovirga yaeyamensis]